MRRGCPAGRPGRRQAAAPGLGVLGWRFYEGDDFHPRANIDKRQRGIPLTDDDRWPWLQALRDVIDVCLAQGTSAAIACSALKQTSRDYLSYDRDGVKLVYSESTPCVMKAFLHRKL